jgi:HAD superfamily hydrolase (TIGR01509 family)
MAEFDPLQALIFDMDGVLVNSEFLHQQAGAQALLDHGIQVPFAELHSQFKGQTDWDMFQKIMQMESPRFGSLDQDKLIQSLITTKGQVFQKLLPQVTLIPGVKRFLQQSRVYYAQLGLTTSAARWEQTAIFETFELGSFFEVVVTADDVKRAKPDPEPYRLTVAQLGGVRCGVIEDSLHGIQSAKEAGCLVIGITTSFSHNELQEAGAMITVDSYSELQDLLWSSKS